MMKDGTIVNQRNIVLIPFPYSNLIDSKRRPALIISNSEYNLNNSDFTCCAITSNPSNYKNSVLISKEDFEEGELFFNSKVRPNRIFTIEQSKAIKILAKLNISKYKNVISNIYNIINLE